MTFEQQLVHDLLNKLSVLDGQHSIGAKTGSYNIKKNHKHVEDMITLLVDYKELLQGYDEVI